MTREIVNRDKQGINGAILIIIGRILLVVTIIGTGFLVALGADGIALVRPLFFFVVGYCFAIVGIRLASGAWSGSLQVVHQSAAISAVSLIAYLLLGMRSRFVINQNGFWLVIILSTVMLISWLIRAKHKQGIKTQ